MNKRGARQNYLLLIDGYDGKSLQIDDKGSQVNTITIGRPIELLIKSSDPKGKDTDYIDQPVLLLPRPTDSTTSESTAVGNSESFDHSNH